MRNDGVQREHAEDVAADGDDVLREDVDLGRRDALLLAEALDAAGVDDLLARLGPGP